MINTKRYTWFSFLRKNMCVCCYCCACVWMYIPMLFFFYKVLMYFWRSKVDVRYLPWLLLTLYLVRVSSSWTQSLLSWIIFIGNLFCGFHHCLLCTEATTPTWLLHGIGELNSSFTLEWQMFYLLNQLALHTKNYNFLSTVFCLLQENLYMTRYGGACL